jgi:putative membrane protein
MSLIISKNNQQIVNTKQDKPISNKIASGKVDVELKMQGNTIFVNDNNFVRWTEEISNNMLKYKGKKIELTGFVFKSDGFKENEFVPARLMMTGNASDSVPVGILAHYNKAKDLKKDTWIIVTGKIKIIDYQGEKSPVIIVKSIQNTIKPRSHYVTP